MANLVKIQGMERLVAKLRALAVKAKDDSRSSVVVGYSTEYAVYVHENLEALHGAAYNAAYIHTTTQVTKSGKPKVEHTWTTAALAQGYGSAKAFPRGENQQAKFLERPARELRGELGDIVIQVVVKGGTVTQGLVAAGLRLQRASQEIVPVETGTLKASAFTRIE